MKVVVAIAPKKLIFDAHVCDTQVLIGLADGPLRSCFIFSLFDAHKCDLQVLIGLADGPTVSYLRLHYFSSEGTRAVIDAINMSEYWGVEGYIIDLRNNPGMPHGSLLSTSQRTWMVFD